MCQTLYLDVSDPLPRCVRLFTYMCQDHFFAYVLLRWWRFRASSIQLASISLMDVEIAFFS